LNAQSFGEAVAKRGEQRLADLYWRHAGDAVRLAFLLTGDQHAAEDIVQDAFVRLFGRFQELRSPEAFEIYLRRTVVNLSRDRFRRLRLERDHAAREANSSSRQLGVASQIEDRELIRHALHGLPHRQRAALVLRFYADLSEQQTAEVLQCSVAAVKSLVTRATASLRERMKGEVP
jgi:RNA polymerase sigma-70 factor (sigma-E family)